MSRKKIGEVASIYRGVSYKKNQASKIKQNNQIALIRANNISAGRFILNDLLFVPKDLVSEQQIVHRDDIVITMSSGSKSHVGKVAIAKDELQCAFGAFCAKISSFAINPMYLFYILSSNSFRNHIENQCKGTNINNIKQSYILDYEIEAPSINQQEKIVSQIEESLSQLDSAVETLKKTKQQLEVYRDTVLKSLFTGSYPSKPLAEISKAISGYAFKSKLYDNSGRYRVVKIGNVKNYHFDFSRDNTRTNEFDERIIEKYLLKHGDCVITLTGSRGKRDYGFVAMINDENDYMLNQRVAALRFDISVAYPKFFMYYLSSIDYRNKFFSYETGNVGQGNVGIKALIEPEVLVPSLQEQMRIVKRIESQLSVCDSIEQTVNQSLQQAEALRQSILKQAFEELK